MSQIRDIRDAIVAANTAVQAQYAGAKGDLLARHTSEADEMQRRHADEAKGLDDTYSVKIAYLGNLAAVTPPDGAFAEEG